MCLWNLILTEIINAVNDMLSDRSLNFIFIFINCLKYGVIYFYFLISSQYCIYEKKLCIIKQNCNKDF